MLNVLLMIVLWIRHEVICIWIGLLLFIYSVVFRVRSSSEWLLKGSGCDKYFRQDVIMIFALLSTGLLNRFWGWNVGTKGEGFICCLGERRILVITATLLVNTVVYWNKCNALCCALLFCTSKGVSWGHVKGILCILESFSRPHPSQFQFCCLWSY